MLWLSHYPFQAASVDPQYLPTPFLMGFITRQLYFVMNPIFSLLLLRPSKSSGALKNNPTFGFLTFGYALKEQALGSACMEKVSCILGTNYKFNFDSSCPELKLSMISLHSLLSLSVSFPLREKYLLLQRKMIITLHSMSPQYLSITSLSEQSEAQPTEHIFLFYKMMYCSRTSKSRGSYVRLDNFLQRSQQINFYVIKKPQNDQNQNVILTQRGS